MELGIFERQMRLVALLTQNRRYTLEELSKRLDMSVRTIYRYIEMLRDTGFVMERDGAYWRIDKSSPWLREITDRIHFTDDEALTLRHILDGVSYANVEARLLRSKLGRIYDCGLGTEISEVDERVGQNLQTLYDAMRQTRVVILRDYQSASSRTVSDRAVEPFQLLHGGSEVRAYEIASGQCKTFKLSRIGRVEVVELLWSFQKSHQSLRVDAFGFSGQETQTVVLRLGSLSQRLLREEYPEAAQYLEGDTLTLPVCSFLGIGRFALGLCEDIEVVENDSFRDYLRQKMATQTLAGGSPTAGS